MLCGNGTEHVTDASAAITVALHCGVASNLTCSDNLHWRCVHFDPAARMVLCIAPFGNKNASISFSRDVHNALQMLVRSWAPTWTVQSTALAMQSRTDAHSCGVWAVWINDQWMQFVQAGLPSPGFEEWSQQKLLQPLPDASSSTPEQGYLRQYYGNLISSTDNLDGPATRLLYRPVYFTKLIEYWVGRHGTGDALPLQRLRALHAQRRGGPRDTVDMINDEGETPGLDPANTGHSAQPVKKGNKPHACMDGRQTKSNAARIHKYAAQTTRAPKMDKLGHGLQPELAACNPGAKAPPRASNHVFQPHGKQEGVGPAHKANAEVLGTKNKRQCSLTRFWGTNAAATPMHEQQHAPPNNQHRKWPHLCSLFLSESAHLLERYGADNSARRAPAAPRGRGPGRRRADRNKTDGPHAKEVLFIVQPRKILESIQLEPTLGTMFRHKARKWRSGSTDSQKLVPQGCFTRFPVEREHRSHLLQLLLQPPQSSALLLQAVYMPFDSGLRQSIYEAVNSAGKAHPHTVVVGDMNAALFPHDRTCSQRTTLDRQHEQFVADSNLQPTDTSHRPFSFAVRSEDCDANIRSSRIDDVLVSQSICEHLRTPYTTVLAATDDSDHLPLLATLELGKERKGYAVRRLSRT